MHNDELCSWIDTFIDYFLVPIVAVIVFFIVINPITAKFLEMHIAEGFWVYFFDSVILFTSVYLAGLVKIRRKNCIDRGTLRNVDY